MSKAGSSRTTAKSWAEVGATGSIETTGAWGGSLALTTSIVTVAVSTEMPSVAVKENASTPVNCESGV